MMKKLILPLFIFFGTALNAQTEVVSGITMGKDYGVVYSLPKTEINIEIKAVKVTYTPGEFSRYADRYLRLSDVSGNPEEYWELSEVIASAIGIPDNGNTYFIKMKDKSVAPLVELTEDGIIKSINMPYTGKKTKEEATPTTPNGKKINPKDFFTQDIIISSSTAKMAELVANEIYNIRESRNTLLRGQSETMPTDGAQLKLMLDNLNLQETAMIEMFSGTTTREEKKYIIRVSPVKEMKEEVIFRFSQKLGIIAKDNLAGEPVYLNVTNLKTVRIPQEEGTKKKTVTGVAYNVPGKAHVTITNGKENLFENDFPVTQFGIVEYLAPTLFNKNSTIKVLFNPQTGGLTKVERE